MPCIKPTKEIAYSVSLTPFLILQGQKGACLRERNIEIRLFIAEN